jgi:hypothetical protein
LGSLSVCGLDLAISVLMRNLVWSAIAILSLMVLTRAFSSSLCSF